MSRNLRRIVLLAYVGAAAAWLAYAAYLGFAYDMFADVVIGAVKILVAVTAITGLAIMTIRWAIRGAIGRLGRPAPSRDGSPIAVMRDAPTDH